MPRKIRELIAELAKAGFILKPGKGSHRKLTHPKGPVVIISGAPGDDAKTYQEKDIRKAIDQTHN